MITHFNSEYSKNVFLQQQISLLMEAFAHEFTKNKLVILSPVIALLILFIFSLTLFPSVQAQPKLLPIAIVNEDQGVQLPDQPKTNMGEKIVEMIQRQSKGNTDEEPAVKWINVKTEEAAQKGMDDQKYYAALIIPEDFSAKQASLRTPSPSPSEVQIYVNQGMHQAASAMAGQILNGTVDAMNSSVRTQILDGFEKQGAALTAKQAEIIASPITKTVTNVNETGPDSANGNSPVSLFQPLWMASLASAAILFIASTKLPVSNRKQNFTVKIAQIAMGAVISLVAGFGLTFLADQLVGLNIPQFADTALFLSITAFSFFLMVLAVLSLTGLKGIPIFVLLLFFGAPLLAMAPEMMSSFYRDWIYSWLPMRFMIEGLRELFFFGKGLTWSAPLSSLVWIGAAGFVIILLSSLKRSAEKQVSQTNVEADQL